MKKFFIVILTLLLAAPLYSQVKFGIKAGVSTDFPYSSQELIGEGVDLVLEDLENAQWGFQGGAFLRAAFGGFYVQPELLIATATNTLTLEGTVDGQPFNEVLDQKFTKLNIPVMLGFKLAFLRIHAGPAASILFSDPEELTDVKATYNKATFGYQAGVGFDLFERLTFDIRYEGNLSKFGEEVEIMGETFTFDDRSSSLIMHIGFMF
jgi:Outer membrane protein beta-barrel domain